MVVKLLLTAWFAGAIACGVPALYECEEPQEPDGLTLMECRVVSVAAAVVWPVRVVSIVTKGRKPHERD